MLNIAQTNERDQGIFLGNKCYFSIVRERTKILKHGALENGENMTTDV